MYEQLGLETHREKTSMRLKDGHIIAYYIITVGNRKFKRKIDLTEQIIRKDNRW